MEATSLAAHSIPSLKLNTRPSVYERHPSKPNPLRHFSKLKSSPSFPCQYEFEPVRYVFTVRSSKLSPLDSDVGKDSNDLESIAEFKVEEVGSPIVPASVTPPVLSLTDQAFFLWYFIACTTFVSMVGFVAAAVPAMFAMRRVAISLTKLADVCHKEIPATMAAIKLTGIELSDLILELSELSREISDGVSKSAHAVQAADAGIRQIGSFAREQTMSMIEERANLPEVSLQLVVAGAAKKTSHAVGRATRTFLSIFSRRELVYENEDGTDLDGLEV